MSYKLTGSQHEARLLLYQAGYIDAEIARVCFVGRDTIAKWRQKHNLPRNTGDKGARKRGRHRKAG